MLHNPWLLGRGENGCTEPNRTATPPKSMLDAGILEDSMGMRSPVVSLIGAALHSAFTPPLSCADHFATFE